MSTTTSRPTWLIDDDVWAGVRRRRGPSTWVVVVAALLSLVLIGGATAVVTRGYTQPQLVSDGWSSRWDAAGSTAVMEVRLGNAGAREITVTGAEIIGQDGAPVPFARVVSLTPLTMDGLLPGATADSIYVLPMSVTVDCPSALAYDETQRPVTLVLRTSGTWLHHDVPVADPFDVAGFCSTS